MNHESRRYSVIGLSAVALVALLTVAGPTSRPVAAADTNDAAQANRQFTLKVLPLFKAQCFACHGDNPKDVKGAFDVRSRAALLNGGESEEPAIVPGKPEQSLLFKAIRWVELEMPPKENDRLTAEQIELVRRWIAAGAPWPDDDDLC